MKPGIKNTVLIGLLALAYLIGAQAGSLVAIPPGNITPVFPPSGIALAALLWGGRGLWPGIVLGAWPANFLPMTYAEGHVISAAAASLLIALGSLCQALVGHFVLSRWADGKRFAETPRGVVRFVGLEALVCVISPTIGVSALVAFGLIPSDRFATTWLTFWLGDLGGVYLIVPLLATVRNQLRRVALWEPLVVGAGILLIGQVTYGLPFPAAPLKAPLGFLSVPIVVWAGLRFGSRAVGWVIFSIFLFALWGTSMGRGPFAAVSTAASLPVLDLFLGVLTFTGLLLAAVAHQRDLAEHSLLETQRELEQRVQSRTIDLEQANLDLRSQVEKRREAQADLARARAWLEVGFDNVPFDVFVCDREGRYVYQNVASIRNWGKQLGKLPEDLGLPEAIVQEWIDSNQRALAGQTVAETARYERNGATVVVQKLLAPISKNGRTEGFVGINIDVTERERLLDELERSTKLEMVGRLAGGVAHDFNNLLTAIMGHMTMLAEEPSMSVQGRESLVIVNDAIKRASELTMQLLSLAGQRMSAPKLFELAAVLKDHVALAKPMLGPDIQLSLEVPEDAWPVFMDLGQLKQVLMNLSVNARDAMQSSGRLAFSVRNRAAEESPLGAESVELIVSDSGPGVPSHLRSQIFEPFFTTKPEGHGTGLGLSVCYGLIARVGGMIMVGAEGTGGEFRVILPRSFSVPDATTVADPDRSVLSRLASTTLLLVEDDLQIRKLNTRVLKQAGYEVLVAQDGIEAEEIALSWPGEISMVVTDLIMPRRGGRELLERLRIKKPNLRAIIVSGYSSEFARHDPNDTRDTFLQKPFSPRDLLALLDQQLSPDILA